MYSWVPEAGGVLSHLANQQMPRAEMLHLGEDTHVPASHTNYDLSVEQVTYQEAKRGRDTQF